MAASRFDPGFDPGQVPIPRPLRPLEQPAGGGTADIILRTAEAQRQDALARDALRQKAFEGLLSALHGTAELGLRARERDIQENVAAAAIELHRAQARHQVEQSKLLESLRTSAAGTGGPQIVQGPGGREFQRVTTPQGVRFQPLPPAMPIEDQDSMAMNMIAGRLAPSQLPGFGQNSLKARVMSRVAQLKPDFDFAQAELNYIPRATIARTEAGTTLQLRERSGESILPNFKEVVGLAKQLNLSKLAIANRVKLGALRQVNDPTVARYDTLRASVAEEMARYFGGGVASDTKIRLGQTILGNDGANAEAIESGLLGEGGAYNVIQNQIKALKGQTAAQIEAATPRGPRPAATASPGPIIERVLKNGRRVKVRDLGGGRSQEVP